jgi:hypothetical protein
LGRWESHGPQTLVKLKLTNTSPTKVVKFAGWQETATLEDEHGNRYGAVTFGRDFGGFMEGTGWNWEPGLGRDDASIDTSAILAYNLSLHPGKSYITYLFFAETAGVAREARLTMPAAALGGVGKVRLRVAIYSEERDRAQRAKAEWQAKQAASVRVEQKEKEPTPQERAEQRVRAIETTNKATRERARAAREDKPAERPEPGAEEEKKSAKEEKPLDLAAVFRRMVELDAVFAETLSTGNAALRKQVEQALTKERGALKGQPVQGIALVNRVEEKGFMVVIMSLPALSPHKAIVATAADPEDPILVTLQKGQAVQVKGRIAGAVKDLVLTGCTFDTKPKLGGGRRAQKPNTP